ncbi:hypothetical protein [Candidatus Darwinibacter acetoxidans]
MREPIDTVPTDGRLVILEDDANAAFKVARWSAEAGCWVGEEGEPSRIMPKYWHPLSPWHPLSQENYQPATVRRGFGHFSFFPRRVTRDGSRAPKDEAASPGFVAVATSLANVGAQAARHEAGRGSDARWRLGVSSLFSTLFGAARDASLFRGKPAANLERSAHQIGVVRKNVVGTQRRLTVSVITAILVGAVLIGVMFRFELATYSMHYAKQFGAVSSNVIERISKLYGLSSTRQSQIPQASPRGQETVHRSLESSLDGTNEHLRVMENVEEKAAPRETFNENRQANDLGNMISALQHSLQQERARAEALARDLAAARRELEASAAESSNTVAEAARAKQSAESATAELRQLLQQERARAEALARELATARREIDASVVQPNMQSRAEEQIPSAPKLLSIPATPAPRPALTSAAPSSHPPSIIPTPVPRPALTSAATPSQPAIRRRSRSVPRQSVKSKPRSSSRSDLTFGTRKRLFQQPTKRLP